MLLLSLLCVQKVVQEYGGPLKLLTEQMLYWAIYTYVFKS